MLRHPKAADDVLAQGTDDEMILLSVKRGQYYTLNQVGVRIWELCDGANSVDEIASTICGEFDADDREITADVNELIEHLSAEALLVEGA